MKQFLLLLSFVASTYLANAQTADVELPLRFVAGYGPLYPDLRGPFWQDEADQSWSRTFPTLRGLPTTWQEIKQGYALLDANQFVYQHAKAGTLPPHIYEGYRSRPGWPSDTTNLTARPIRCSVAIITGKDEAGQRVAMIDTDNDLDFADEEPVNLLPVKVLNQPDPTSIRLVDWEHHERRLVAPAQTPISVVLSGDRVMYTFPTHGIALFNAGKTVDTLIVTSGNFVSASFQPSAILSLTDSVTVAQLARNRTGKVSYSMMSKQGEFVRAHGQIYQFLGVDLGKQVVRLRPMPTDTLLYSTQLYYEAPPFSTTEFTSQQPLSLAAYRGKYVLLDFWGTWCAPCLRQMKYLKEAYANTSREKLDIIGIVADDTPGRLRDYLTKEGIIWPQVIADEVNRLVSLYQVKSYPTTILIDPKGRVLIKNLQGRNMADILIQIGQVRK